MREIRTEIEISAPSTAVWDILTNFDKWKDWNPIVNNIIGEATLGTKLKITMRGKNGKDAQRYQAEITKVDEPLYFSWRATMITGFLFTNDKIFELKKSATGTRLTHIETFSGLLVSLFWGKLSSHVLKMLNAMNEALKKTIEK